ncbi:MAG: hypothetical protein AUJ01_15050 [Acidobacteria bacterium 13_1_40CM_3_65_5]|nr:MAG: hypothetical protein AUJ01_15050 [Acidobacteria bacterium 13_1_40CM_3_65_5]
MSRFEEFVFFVSRHAACTLRMLAADQRGIIGNRRARDVAFFRRPSKRCLEQLDVVVTRAGGATRRDERRVQRFELVFSDRRERPATQAAPISTDVIADRLQQPRIVAPGHFAAGFRDALHVDLCKHVEGDG